MDLVANGTDTPHGTDPLGPSEHTLPSASSHAAEKDQVSEPATPTVRPDAEQPGTASQETPNQNLAVLNGAFESPNPPESVLMVKDSSEPPELALLVDGDRRRSGRVRHVPKEFVPEPIKPKAVRNPKTKSKKKAEAKPSLMANIRYLNLAARPEFTPIQLDCSRDVFWLRLNLREFLLRFDKLCRLPTRHATTINDPMQPWNDYLYKATVVALFRLIENDNTPIFEYARHYLMEIEHTPAESAALWTFVYEFLEQSDPYVNRADPLTGEHYRLELIRRLMVLVTGTETIRLTILNDHEQLRQLQMDQSERIKTINSQLAASTQKLEKLKASDQALYFDRVAAAERSAADKRLRAEQTLHSQTHKYTLRTVPLGQDSDGNIYWSLQQKSKDIPSWGTWIVCELVWPVELLEKRIRSVKQQVGQLFKNKKKAPKAENEPVIVKLTIPSSTAEGSADKGAEAEDLVAPPVPVPSNDPAKPEKPAGPPKPEKKRKPMVPPKEKTLYYVSGKENIAALANWVENQLGRSNAKLATAIKEIALYLQE